MTFPYDPSLIDEESFLLGPYLDNEQPVVDDVFAKDFRTVSADILADDPHALDPIEGEPETPSDIDPGLVFRATSSGIVLFDGDIPVGGILGVDIVLSPDRRGKGLGAEIVLENYMRNGEFAFWHLDEPAFSPAGLRTMSAAYRMGCDRSVFARKSERLVAVLGNGPLV